MAVFRSASEDEKTRDDGFLLANLSRGGVATRNFLTGVLLECRKAAASDKSLLGFSEDDLRQDGEASVLDDVLGRFILGPVGGFIAELELEQRRLNTVIVYPEILQLWVLCAVEYAWAGTTAVNKVGSAQRPLMEGTISNTEVADMVTALQTLPSAATDENAVSHLSDLVMQARVVSDSAQGLVFSERLFRDLADYNSWVGPSAPANLSGTGQSEAAKKETAKLVWNRILTLAQILSSWMNYTERSTKHISLNQRQKSSLSDLTEFFSDTGLLGATLEGYWDALAERNAAVADRQVQRDRELQRRQQAATDALARRAAAAAATQAAAAESARRRYEEQCTQAAQYFAAFQKVPLSPDLQTFVDSLGSVAVKRQGTDKRDALVLAIEYAREIVIDGRGLRTAPDSSAPTVTCDPDVASFAALLFGRENVVQMLLAQGLELKPFNLAIPSHTPNLDVLGKVSELYERSAAVRAIVDQLGSMDDTIGLVATLGLPFNQVRDGQRDELVTAMRKSFSDASTVRRAKVRLTPAERESLGGETGKGVDLGSVSTTLGLAPSEWRLEQQGSGVLVVELGEQQPPPVVVVLTKGDLKDLSRLKGIFDKKLAEARLNAEVERGINFLELNSGLVVERDAQGVPVRVSHPGCDLGEEVLTPLGHFWRELDRIQSMVLAYQSRVEALQVSLETAGFKLNVEARRVTVTTPRGETVEVSPSQYLTSEQFVQIEDMWFTPASTSASTTDGAVRGKAILESKDEVLVVDAGVLMRLGIGNEYGGSFLEVLSAAASSKGNIRVWIPSTVYTELTGEAIFVRDGQVRANELWSGRASPALTDFFNSCSHVSLQNDGTVSVPTRGRANERICIVHSDGDAQLFSASVSARTAKGGSEASARNLWTNQGRGDDSITWIIEHLRGDQRGITVATLDRVYTSTKMPRRCKNERPVIPLMLEQMLAALTSLPYVQQELGVGAGYGSYASRIIQDNARIEPSLRFSWINPLGPGGLAAFLTRIGHTAR